MVRKGCRASEPWIKSFERFYPIHSLTGEDLHAVARLARKQEHLHGQTKLNREKKTKWQG